MLRGPQLERWKDFYEGARDSDALDPRTTVLVQLASALSLGCDP